MDDSPLFLAVGLAVYILVSRLVMRTLTGGPRDAIMALLNLAGVFLFLLHTPLNPLAHAARLLGYYLLLVILQFVMLRLFVGARGWRFWPAFFSPLAILIVLRYVPSQVFAALGQVVGKHWLGVPPPHRHFLSGLPLQPAGLGGPQRFRAQTDPRPISRLRLLSAHDASRPHQYLRQFPARL